MLRKQMCNKKIQQVTYSKTTLRKWKYTSPETGKPALVTVQIAYGLVPYFQCMDTYREFFLFSA